jgi:di/tricarboxylate transporter
MSFSLQELAVLAPFQLSTLSLVPVAGMVSESPERAFELYQYPVAGIIIGAFVIAANAVYQTRLARIAHNTVPA